MDESLRRFPDWRSRLAGLLGQSHTRVLRSGRNVLSRDAAMDFIQDIFQEAGVRLRVTRRGFYWPFYGTSDQSPRGASSSLRGGSNHYGPGELYSPPTRIEDLDELLRQAAEEFELEQIADAMNDFAAEQAEQGEEDPNFDIPGAQPFNLQDSSELDEPLDLGEPAPDGTVCIRGYYVMAGEQNPDIYSRFEDYTVVIQDYGDYRILTEDLGDRTRSAMLQRSAAFYRNVDAVSGVDMDDYDDTDRSFVDAEIVTAGPCGLDLPEDELQALQQGQGRSHVAAVPTSLHPSHERNRFRHPTSRLSYNTDVFVDHPGIVYSSDEDHILQEYTDPYVRHSQVEDCCWMTCIIDMVNVAMRKNYFTYYKLWAFMGMPGAFSPERARRGFSVEDMVPLFEKLDRSVTIYDGERNVIYERKRSSTKYQNVRPFSWSFVVTEHHVFALERARLAGCKHLVNRHGVYDEVLVDHPYERISPMLPRYEVRPPAVLQQSSPRGPRSKERLPSKILFLCADGASRGEYATLHDILFARCYDNHDLHVVVQCNLMRTVLLQLVVKYRYRPTVTGNTKFISSVIVQSLANRGTIRFVNPVGAKRESRGHLPSPDDSPEHYFRDSKQYLDYVAAGHSFYSSVASGDLCSILHESTANVARSLVRGGLFGWTIPVAHAAGVEGEWCSLDVNRIYPSTLQTDMLPTCNVFDRFESVPSRENPSSFLRELQPMDLVLIYAYDTPSLYIDRGAALCFVHNLRDFVRRSGVVLVDGLFQPTMHSHPGGCTYVRLCAVLHTTPRKSSAWSAVAATWENQALDRDLRKKVLVRGLGRLGKTYNSTGDNMNIFCNPEEATVFSQERKGEVVSIEDELYLAYVKGDSIPRLEGHYLIHLYILDTYRSMMQHWYDKITARGVRVLYVRCDEFFFHKDDMPLVEDLVYHADSDSLEAFGMLKVGHSCVPLEQLGFCSAGQFLLNSFISPTEVHYEICSAETVCPDEVEQMVVPVEPRPDEYTIANLDDYSRVLVKATVPGAGKSHAVLSRYGSKVLVVCPTNALCVEFTAKYPGCTAMTLHRFLRVGIVNHTDENQQEDGCLMERMRQPEHKRVLLLDEIFMYSLPLLSKLYFRLEITGAWKVFATGDPNQLPPVHEETGDELFTPTDAKVKRMRAVDFLFPHQMTLHVCKRGTDPEDNKRMEYLTQCMKSPGYTIQHIIEMVRDQFTGITFRQAVGMMKQDPYDYVAVCYYNHTCHRIARAVLPNSTKLAEGVRLVNRARKQLSSGVLMVNYEYVVKEVKDRSVVVEDVMVPGSAIDVPNWHVNNNMHWSQTRTCHSLQGSSVSASLLLFNLNSRRISPEFIYVALTRARRLKDVFYVENEETF